MPDPIRDYYEWLEGYRSRRRASEFLTSCLWYSLVAVGVAVVAVFIYAVVVAFLVVA